MISGQEMEIYFFLQEVEVGGTEVTSNFAGQVTTERYDTSFLPGVGELTLCKFKGTQLVKMVIR